MNSFGGRIIGIVVCGTLGALAGFLVAVWTTVGGVGGALVAVAVATVVASAAFTGWTMLGGTIDVKGSARAK